MSCLPAYGIVNGLRTGRQEDIVSLSLIILSFILIYYATGYRKLRLDDRSLTITNGFLRKTLLISDLRVMMTTIKEVKSIKVPIVRAYYGDQNKSVEIYYKHFREEDWADFLDLVILANPDLALCESLEAFRRYMGKS